MMSKSCFILPLLLFFGCVVSLSAQSEDIYAEEPSNSVHYPVYRWQRPMGEEILPTEPASPIASVPVQDDLSLILMLILIGMWLEYREIKRSL